MTREVLKMNIKVTRNMKRKVTGSVWSLIRILFLLGVSYVVLYPLLTKLALVFMDYQDLTDYTIIWVPKHFTFSNVTTVAKIMDYGTGLLKTIAICALVSVLQIFVTTISAYGLARYKSKLRSVIFALVIGTLIIPPQTYLVTLYTQFKEFDPFGLVSHFTNSSNGIIDTVLVFVMLAITGMGIRSGLYIYIERQTFRGLPKELEEAAKVDGAGILSTFWRIMLPNARPTVVLCLILSFIWQWNDTFYTSLFCPEIETLSMKLGSLSVDVAEYLGGWSFVGGSRSQQLISIGAFLCIIPLVFLFILCQRFFVQGVERSGLVG